MFIHDWKKDVFTIPNVLSLFRLGLIPVYMSLYLRAATPRAYYVAGGILALSCLTDLADGFIARRFHMTSRLGRFLDPAADKATQLALALCLSCRYRVLEPVLLVLVLKESVQLLANLLCLRRGKILQGALPAGKVCTAILFISFLMLVLFPQIPAWMVRFLAFGDLTCLLYAFFRYLLVFLGNSRAVYLEDWNATE